MTFLPTSNGFNPNWAAIAQILGSAMAAPDGQYAQGAAQGAQNYQNYRSAQQDQQYRQQQMDMQRQEFDLRKAEYDRQVKAEQDWRNQFSMPQVAQATGPIRPDQPRGYQTAANTSQQPDWIANMSPEQRAFMVMAGPETGMSILADRLFAKPNEGPASVQEYEYALKQGFQGSIFDYQRKKAEAGRTPAQAPQDPERVRLAKAAGLIPGTPEYQQFLLGRDDTPPGPFQGTSLDAQAYNIVLTGDPSSPEYAAAYAQLGQPKTSMDPNTNQIVSIQPDLSWARKPTGQTAAPVNPNLSTTQLPGATVTSQAPDTMALTPEQRNKFKQQTLAIDNLESALTQYEAALDKYGSMETYGAGKGVLETAYANVLIQAKEAANLGALTGPDMDIMNQTIIAPNSFGQATVGGANGVKAQMQSVRDQLKQKRANLNYLYGPQKSGGDVPPPPPGFEPLQ